MSTNETKSKDLALRMSCLANDIKAQTVEYCYKGHIEILRSLRMNINLLVGYQNELEKLHE